VRSRPAVEPLLDHAASSNGAPATSPVAEIAWAISPFEYGRPWPLWTTMVSAATSRYRLTSASSIPRPVADEDHARALAPRAQRDRVDRGGLQLGEVDVGALRGRAVEVLGERGAPARLVETSDGVRDVAAPRSRRW
jgi:hypothetical protein